MSPHSACVCVRNKPSGGVSQGWFQVSVGAVCSQAAALLEVLSSRRLCFVEISGQKIFNWGDSNISSTLKKKKKKTFTMWPGDLILFAHSGCGTGDYWEILQIRVWHCDWPHRQIGRYWALLENILKWNFEWDLHRLTLWRAVSLCYCRKWNLISKGCGCVTNQASVMQLHLGIH